VPDISCAIILNIGCSTHSTSFRIHIQALRNPLKLDQYLVRVSPYPSASRPASSRFSTTAPVTVFVFRSFFLQIKIHDEIPFMTHSECVIMTHPGHCFGILRPSFLFLLVPLLPPSLPTSLCVPYPTFPHWLGLSTFCSYVFPLRVCRLLVTSLCRMV
jgi:hypothetical protein